MYDEVMITHSSKEGQSIITVNCPDKTGLGCDLCRVILFFGLSIFKADLSTDGRWCYIVFWVGGSDETRWGLLKKRLLEACPSFSSASGISYFLPESRPPKPADVFLLKLCCHDRKGLLHDTARVLFDLELTIKKVQVSTTPDGSLVNLFFVTDTRELLHSISRKQDTKEYLREVIGSSLISIEIQKVGPEVTACTNESSFLPSSVTEDTPNTHSSCLPASRVSVKVDNKLSPSQTLIQIICQDHKGLLYDVMRTLKDYNINTSYGRFGVKTSGECEVDLFVRQGDGKKIGDSDKQKELATRLLREIRRPLRVSVASRGPDTEVLVANPVELSGKGRPLVFHDITLALKLLETHVFTAEIRRRMIGDREFEVYRILVEDGEKVNASRSEIEIGIWKRLMGWV